MIPAPTEEQRQRWYADGCALLTRIEGVAGFPDCLLDAERHAVAEFRGRGPWKASDIALLRLRLILRRLEGRAER